MFALKLHLSVVFMWIMFCYSNEKWLHVAELFTVELLGDNDCGIETQKTCALTEEHIHIAYCSLQAEDAKELLNNPELKPKGHYQQRIAALLGYSNPNCWTGVS